MKNLPPGKRRLHLPPSLEATSTTHLCGEFLRWWGLGGEGCPSIGQSEKE